MREVSIAQLGRVVTGKTPKTADAKNFGGDIPFVTPSDMDERRVIDTTDRCLTEQGTASVRNCVIPGGSVLVSCIGSDMGKTRLSHVRCVTNQQINAVVIDPETANPMFVFYNLCKRPPITLVV